MTPPAGMHWWLVGTPGNLPAGNPAKVVASPARPTGYKYVAPLAGHTLADVEQSLAHAVFNLPNGIAVPNGTITIPGLGKAKAHGPGGIAGGIDSAATTAGNTITSALDLFGNSAFWVRLGEAILGVVLLALGLRALTGQAA